MNTLTRQGFCLCFVLFSSIFRGGATALCWGRCEACLGYYDAFATNGRAAFRGELLLFPEGTTLARFVLDGSFEGLAMNKAWRRQWAARAVTDLCDENKAWTTGWHRLRVVSNAEFRDAVTEAAALHAHDELFSKHIEPEPAPEDPVDWAMAEASDDEDDAPMPVAPPEPELIDMPPAPASAPRMSNLERCIALRLVYGAGPR